MGFYETESCQTKTDPRSENRVGGSRRFASTRTRFQPTQTPDTTSETSVTITITVSGLSFWPSRDPIGDLGFVLSTLGHRNVRVPGNLYIGLNNNPVSLVDPLGLYVDVGPVGTGTIQIGDRIISWKSVRLSMKFWFDECCPKESVDAWVSAIKDTWSGTFGIYRVRMNVEVVEERGDRVNTIYCEEGIRSYATVGQSLGWGKWDPTDGGDVAAHESGHLMGLIDRYSEQIRDPFTPAEDSDAVHYYTTEEGVVIQVTEEEGYVGSIMARTGGSPIEQNIEAIINGGD